MMVEEAGAWRHGPASSMAKCPQTSVPDDGGIRGRTLPTCVGLTAPELHGRERSPVHPHVRRAHAEYDDAFTVHGGPSPRAWGSRSALVFTDWAQRPIPTCVGLTCRRSVSASSMTAHPHVRGAHQGDGRDAPANRGPSPRAWGSHPRAALPAPDGRPIPTCVGLTGAGTPTGTRWSAHPHVRGAHALATRARCHSPGPSPRAWGSQQRRQRRRAFGRPIPTCVGLTLNDLRQRSALSSRDLLAG